MFQSLTVTNLLIQIVTTGENDRYLGINENNTCNGSRFSKEYQIRKAFGQ